MSPIARPLIQKLLASSSSAGSKQLKSLPFVEVADALDVIASEASHSKATQTKVLQLLFERALDIALQESTENAVLEIYLLLRMLIPSQDHENVYGIKTHRLIKLSSALLKQKLGRSDAAAQLERWLGDPAPQYSQLKKGQGIVCLPEVVISTLITSAVRPQASACNYTIQDVAILCARLTEAYLTASTQLPGIDTLQMEVLYEASQHFSFKEWVLFFRILLKKVSVGVGPKTVLNCMPHLMAPVLYQRQHDLASLATASVKHGSDPSEVWKRQPTPVACGIPIVPMTCETLKSPFLFTELFSRENKLRKPISPKDGRLVIAQSRWYIPMIHNAKQKTYVSIEDPSSLRSKSRKTHVILLREFKKCEFINEAACSGLVLHYTLSTENDNTIVMLIRFASDAAQENIELMDGTSLGERNSSSCPIKEEKSSDSDEKKEPKNKGKKECELFSLENPTWIQSTIINPSKAPESKETESGTTVTLKNNKIVKLLVVTNDESLNQKNKKQEREKQNNTPQKKVQSTTAAADDSSISIGSKTKRIPLLARKDKQKVSSPKVKALNVSSIPKTKNSEQAQSEREQQDEVKLDEERVLVQVKYDGDRIQAHIKKITVQEVPPANTSSSAASNDHSLHPPKQTQSHNTSSQVLDVRLYTKWGKDVSELYSNIRDCLQSNPRLVDCAPCILDGELIAVESKTGTPLPWSSEKWKYNVKDSQGVKLSQLATSKFSVVPTTGSGATADSDIVSIVYDTDIDDKEEDSSLLSGGKTTTKSTVNNNKDEEDSEDPITFASLKELRKWTGIGPLDKDNLYVKPILNAKLQYVIFDIILHQDKAVHELPCVKRYELLKSMYKDRLEGFANSSVIVIPNTLMINKTADLIEALKNTVLNEQEGLVLKDPRSPYEFGKSKSVQKLKIGGPDINTCVLGIGFSYSTNPRRWGLLSCVSANSASNHQFMHYTRVEVIEGCSDPWKAFEHVYKLKSRVRVVDVIKSLNLHSAKNHNKAVTLSNDTFDIVATKKNSASPINNAYIEMNWTAKADELSYLNCQVVLKKQSLLDIQWLCNPLECGFRMSLRGDLWPITKPDNGALLLYPRHPVARLELNGHQASITCDTLEEINKKYEASRQISECIQQSFRQTVLRLRPLLPPPINDSKLKLLHQIMLGYQSTHENPTANKHGATWPSSIYQGSGSETSAIISLDKFTSLLASFRNKHHDLSTLFQPLTPEEKLVLMKIPSSHTLWTLIEQQTVKHKHAALQENETPDEQVENKINDEQDTIEEAEKLSQFQKLTTRLKELSEKIKKPVVKSSQSFAENSTTCNSREGATMLDDDATEIMSDSSYGSDLDSGSSEEDS